MREGGTAEGLEPGRFTGLVGEHAQRRRGGRREEGGGDGGRISDGAKGRRGGEGWWPAEGPAGQDVEHRARPKTT